MKPAKTSIKHPYAAIEHRVIDSPAYADLTFSARSLLTLITRQLSKDNNGHLQATFTYMERFGFSVNTLSRATHELIAHGMIYKTKSGGFHLGAAKFAVTWLPVKNSNGIFMQGFKSCAWREWTPGTPKEKKTRPPRLRAHSLKNGELTTPTHPKSEAIPPPKSEHIELLPCRGTDSALDSVHEQTERVHDSDLTNGYWDTDSGEWIATPVKKKTRSPKIETMREKIKALPPRANAIP